jgi:cyclophilin family peptidyl-prolyl cis-trans isomerase
MITNIIGILIFIIFVYVILKLQRNNKLIKFDNKKNKKDNKQKDNKQKDNKQKDNKQKDNKQKDNKQKDNKQKDNIQQDNIVDKIPEEMIRNIKPIETKATEDNNLVYIEVEINGVVIGDIIIKLFDNIVPKTCNNFRKLCETKKYITAPFHRIIKDFMLQSGDFTNYNGTGGVSIYGKQFEDENFKLKHDRPYLLSMANSGPNTNGSQFFITTQETPHLNGKHVVFGEVIKGFEIVKKLNLTKTDNDDKPVDNIVISDCGIN